MLAAFSVVASEWPQWRGPERDGQFRGIPWPSSVGAEHLEQVWRVELEPSYSGPIVTADRVFTTETRDKKREVVTALDRVSGKVLWETGWDGAMSVPFFARSNGSWIRSTPAWDGEHLYVAGMRDVLVCLNGATGEVVWQKDFVKELDAPEPDFGFVCSPLVDGEDLYVQAGASFLKLDKRTGEIQWRALQDKGGMWGSVFSSPVMVELAGLRQLLVQTRNTLAGVDPVEGTILWQQEVKAFRGMNILTPLVHGDVVFTSTYGGKTIGYRVERADGGFRVEEAWSYKAQGYMSTPVVVEGVAYEHLRSQRVVAIDLKSGTERWTSDESFGKYWSLVAQGDRILALDERGELILMRANPEQMEILDRRKIAEQDTWAHLAVVEDGLYVRELNALAAYRWRR
ncbi:MAG: PQQ-binding-like beta-propeller repeat protein [Steroidobacteraceae bacterium]